MERVTARSVEYAAVVAFYLILVGITGTPVTDTALLYFVRTKNMDKSIYSVVHNPGDFVSCGGVPYLVTHAAEWADCLGKPYSETEHIIAVSHHPKAAGNLVHYLNKQNVVKLSNCTTWEQAIDACALK